MKIDTDTLKKQVILHLPYLLFLFVFAKLGQAVRLAPGADASQKLLGLSEGFTLAFQSMWPGAAMDWLVGLGGAVIVRLAVYLKGKDAKKYRKNVEYGSARWGSKTDIAPFMDPKPENNIILTQSEGLMMSGRPKNPANARNKNVLVVGGSGSGKTRFFIKPNLMQMHSSYVVTDPKGTVLIEVGKLLSRGTPKLDKDGKPVRGKNGKIVYEPYKIKVFNTINFSKSMHYNPFAYIHNEKDILKLVTVLIANTKGEGKSGDDFWVKAETLLYTALIGYIYYEAPSNEQNFSTLVEMINAMMVGKPSPNQTTINNLTENQTMGASGEPPAAFGRYQNIFLSQTEYDELQAEYPDRLERFIEEMSRYLAASGRSYQNYAAALRIWAGNDKKKAPKKGIPDYSCREGESL